MTAASCFTWFRMAVLGSEEEGPKDMLLFMESMIVDFERGEVNLRKSDDRWIMSSRKEMWSCRQALKSQGIRIDQWKS